MLLFTGAGVAGSTGGSAENGYWRVQSLFDLDESEVNGRFGLQLFSFAGPEQRTEESRICL